MNGITHMNGVDKEFLEIFQLIRNFMAFLISSIATVYFSYTTTKGVSLVAVSSISLLLLYTLLLCNIPPKIFFTLVIINSLGLLSICSVFPDMATVLLILGFIALFIVLVISVITQVIFKYSVDNIKN